MQDNKVLPQWAPRVRQDRIRRLYEQGARGIYDDDLIDEVGYALLSRCQSFLVATAAVQGRASCSVCGRVVRHSGKKEALLHCECGWTLTWEDYFATIQRKQLSGAEPVVQLFQHFVNGFPAAHSPREKVILIDQLLHGFHRYQQHGYTRPVAVNLIEGKLADVIAFLDSLTYGAASTSGTQETFMVWMQKSWAATIYCMLPKELFMKKSELLNGLQEEYQQWEAFLDQIGPVRMDQPGVSDHWSIKDIVAHLTGWRRRTVARLQAAQRSEPEPPPPWPAHLQTDDEINAWIYESNHGRSVREVLDESHQVFQQLLAAIEGLPDKVLIDPVHHLPWLGGQPFSAGEFFAHFHEEHEPDMRAWLARVEKQ